MTDQIFLLNENDELVKLEATDYPAEEVLQRLLAHYPDLLPGRRSDEIEAAPWLLVAREASIPDDSLAERFALDHLFLDREGVPTLVEVKRVNDTRTRREVVAQMLDYASHFVVHWTSERISNQFAETCRKEDIDPEERLKEFLGHEESEEFWQAVKTNLLARRIRMVFVADRIPPELRRIVEFLNNQMDPAEMLAVEIPQYTGQGFRTFVPRLVGQSVAAQERKNTSTVTRPQWNETRFLADLETRRGRAARETAKKLLNWARHRGLDIWWGRGIANGSFVPQQSIGDVKHFTFACWSSGAIEIYFQHMRNRRPFSEETMRRELLKRLNHITGIDLPVDSLNRRPSISIEVLKHENQLEQFLAVWDWYLEEVHKANVI